MDPAGPWAAGGEAWRGAVAARGGGAGSRVRRGARRPAARGAAAPAHAGAVANRARVPGATAQVRRPRQRKASKVRTLGSHAVTD